MLPIYIPRNGVYIDIIYKMLYYNALKWKIINNRNIFPILKGQDYFAVKKNCNTVKYNVYSYLLYIF